MSVKDDGGYAFACACIDGWQGGMSLRDYFAAQAVAGMTANGELLGAMSKQSSDSAVCARVTAMMAYEIADAMLAERGKPAP